jgi:deoxyribonuclease-1
MEIQKETRTAEPAERIRGDIARTYQYMQAAYGRGIIGKTNKKLFEAWSKQDSVDQWECERAKRIEGIQGNENKVVKEACIQAGLWNGTSAVDSLPSPPKKDKPSADNFSCGNKRYCKDMSTCEEAKFYLNECGLSKLDKDGDGVPCEALCR